MLLVDLRQLLQVMLEIDVGGDHSACMDGFSTLIACGLGCGSGAS